MEAREERAIAPQGHSVGKLWPADEHAGLACRTNSLQTLSGTGRPPPDQRDCAGAVLCGLYREDPGAHPGPHILTRAGHGRSASTGSGSCHRGFASCRLGNLPAKEKDDLMTGTSVEGSWGATADRAKHLPDLEVAWHGRRPRPPLRHRTRGAGAGASRSPNPKKSASPSSTAIISSDEICPNTRLTRRLSTERR